MLKANKLCTQRLRNGELLGVLQETLEFSVALLSNERDASVLDMYRSAVEEYRGALMQDFYIKETRAKNDADDAVYKQYRGMKHLVKSMLLHSNASTRESAEGVMYILEKHGNIWNSSLAHRYSMLDEMIEKINALGAEVHSTLGIDIWLEGLTLAIAKYKVARDVQRRERYEYQKGLVVESRQKAEAAYRDLIETINAHMISFGEEEYLDFVKNVNATVEVQKAIIKSRVTRAENVEEAENADKPATEEGEQVPSDEQSEQKGAVA